MFASLSLSPKRAAALAKRSVAMTLTRGRGRTVVTGAVLVAMTLPLVACQQSSGPALRTEVEFDRELAIPPLASSRVESGTRVFELEAESGASEFLPGTSTPTWGYNGGYLGPTLRARVGERVEVRFTNGLDEETTVHWHGMHLPAEMDGGPHQMVDPGEAWTPSWTIDQVPATLWYHPHPHGKTEEQVYRGLAGFFWIDPEAGPDQRLPHTYGVDDIPVVVQDKKLTDDGELIFDDGGNEIGLLGNLVVANGTAGAYHEVTTERVRLRLLNGSTARTYQFGFSDDRSFAMVASDGGLLTAPHRTERIQLSPGERAEIVVAMKPGERVRLKSFGADLGDVVSSAAFGGEDEVDVLELRAAGTLAESPEPPDRLGEVEPIDEDDAEQVREFVLEGREINGDEMEMDRIDETVTVDTTEVWEVYSRNTFPHNFHVHDVQFQVLSIDGAPPPPELAGYKDTVYLAPQVVYRLGMRFEDYTDPNLPYMYHCHLLLHEDEGMMGQFVVVDPGESAGEVPSSEGHGH